MKTYCFIDSQNLHLGIKSQGWTLDCKKFYIYLKEKYKVDKVYYYVGYIDANKKLYKYLEDSGYVIVFKNNIEVGKFGNVIKGNIDVDLTVDAIRKLNNYDRALFVSADGDFVSLYDYLVNEKAKSINVLIPNMYKYSKFLLKYNKNLRFMNDLRQKLSM